MHSLQRLAIAVLPLCLAACAAGTDPGQPGATPESVPETSQARRSEVTEPRPRLAITHEHGVVVLDGGTLQPLGQFPADGFSRVNSAGDGRHVLWSQGEQFRLLDLGSYSRAHGDHSHHYAGEPRLTKVTFPAAKPGHAVAHDGWLALFDDETATVTSFPQGELENAEALPPRTQQWVAPQPHHGVAIVRRDRSMVVTVGDASTRTGVAVLDADRRPQATSDACPGVHGEAGAADGVLSFGCADGALLVRGTQFTKVTSPDPFGQVSTQSGSEHSPISLGNYVSSRPKDAAAPKERPTRFSLIDTRAGTMRVVDLGTSYSSRSLARGADGAALVLGTDGKLHVFDPETGERRQAWQAVQPWSEPEKWQSPRPTLYALGDVAYVTEPASSTVRAIEISTGRKLAEAKLAEQPNELVAVTG